MEYIEGGTLEDRLFGQPLDWIKAVDLLLPITDALGYAHTQGIIHRDVKPSNILLPQEDWPLLADFGLVKLINSGDDDDDVEEITGPGTAMGTPSYLSPEQARGMPLDYRADIYSLGVLLYEMVTGRLPFTYENPSKLLLAHVNEPAPLPRRFNPACPVGLEQVILRMLHKSPAERYQDMAAVQVAFKEVLASPTVRPQFHSPPVPAPDTQIIAELATTPMDKNTPQPEPVLRKQAQLFLLEQKVSLPVPDQEQVIIGRTHRNIVADIDLGPYGAAEAGLSRHHARLTRQGDHWLIDDLGSLNGTFVNRVKVNPTALSTPLKDGDEIRCSQLSFIFLIQ
jgi:serine/threonine protein kinase